MERTVRVATGESVAFSYELAGVGSRFIAVTVDLAIQALTVIIGSALLLWIGASFPRLASAALDVGRSVVIAIVFIFAFLILFGYFIIMEWLWDGRTPGKRLVGIRVIRDGGFPLDFTASVVRNVIRMLEFGAGFYAVSAISSLLSPTNRRLGDYAAGTLVVREDRYARALLLPEAEEHPALAQITAAERDLAYRYVSRRDGFGRRARAGLASRLAAPLRERMGPDVAGLDDDALLQYVVSVTRGRPEAGRS